MKRLLTIILIIFLLSACEFSPTVETTTTPMPTPIATLVIPYTPTPDLVILQSESNASEDMLKILLRRDSVNKISNHDTGYFEFTDNKKLIYINEEYGFKISFPYYWKDSLNIDKYKDKKVWDINYLGYSDECYLEYEERLQGLNIGTIGSEKDINLYIYDGFTEIGSINGEKYYYATMYQGLLGILDELEFYEDGDRKYDEIQYELMKIDYRIFLLMQDDIYEIMKTFEAID